MRYSVVVVGFRGNYARQVAMRVHNLYIIGTGYRVGRDVYCFVFAFGCQVRARTRKEKKEKKGLSVIIMSSLFPVRNDVHINTISYYIIIIH